MSVLIKIKHHPIGAVSMVGGELTLISCTFSTTLLQSLTSLRFVGMCCVQMGKCRLRRLEAEMAIRRLIIGSRRTTAQSAESTSKFDRKAKTKKDEEKPKAMSELDECQIDVKEEELENHSTALQVFSTSDGTLHPNSFNMISNGISQDQLPFMSFPQPFVAHVEVLKCEGEPAVVRVLANRTLDVLTQLSSHWILVDSSGSICLKLDQNLNETGLTTQQLANRKKMREEDRRWSVSEQIEEEDRSHKKDEKELQAVPIDAQKASVFRLGLVLWDLGL
ncbi:hypothetical protein BLNAU_19591 [Blattamonas nauphoetae]|uniref:Uncharacterized protein n=1 Tax=Blattamonas nauphoetae TaxID=2049346 RepID=A0ABQ9X160_9EUKA|nr:hypothetical protein BLNAU_19591 [Blattamonas nauphoetae]